ncbi:MAG: S8 family serine peptidase [bacterium]
MVRRGVVLATGCCLVLVVGVAAVSAEEFRLDERRDGNTNGVEDILDRWFDGALSWSDLRAEAITDDLAGKSDAAGWPDNVALPTSGDWSNGLLRILCFGRTVADMQLHLAAVASAGGEVGVLHELDRFGGLVTLAIDSPGLAVLVNRWDAGSLLLDRDGRPALNDSRRLVGAEIVHESPWRFKGDWTISVAILDSGCDTAHNDVGDHSDDNVDGPPPNVGDALDWLPADYGWPVYSGYKVIGWHDVTDDFPGAVGPWDYHHHGTALASVVAGEGEVSTDLSGVAPNLRLTIVKFYDFDGIWHQWTSDFLAACDWILQHRDTYRVRIVLAAVNWDEDNGISAAMADLADAGILPVVAMGNGGAEQIPAGYPALSPAALSVGGVNDAGVVAAFSGRGEFGVDKPDLLAPSGGLLSTTGRITVADNEPNDTYSERHGTSLAAAHVAGCASLVLQGMNRAGVPDPSDGQDVRQIAALLKSTAAPVWAAETPDGLGQVDLAADPWPDALRGWGLLQVQSALEAALWPISVGASVTDSLAGANDRLVLARRLALLPGTGCRIEADPTGGLDIQLEIHDLALLSDPSWNWSPERIDARGFGGTERATHDGDGSGLSFVVIKHLAGEGDVTLTILPPTAGDEAAYTMDVGGEIHGWPVVGQLNATSSLSLVLTSFADIDPYARIIHAIAPDGSPQPGWPIFLFLPGSLLGALSAPLAWDLDDSPGDEVVVASDFGKIYFIQDSDTVEEVTVATSDVALSAPFGFVTGSGIKRIGVVGNYQGTLYRFTTAGELLGSVSLGAGEPLAPAVGEIRPALGEEIVIALSDGSVQVLGANGEVAPNWPVDIGPGRIKSPVLVDSDQDGRHEVVVPVVSESGNEIVFRVFNGDASSTPLDGASGSAPSGGEWLSVSDPTVAGSGDDLCVAVTGLVSNGGSGRTAVWNLMVAKLVANGTVQVEPLPGFEVRGVTNTGRLRLRWQQLPPPAAWDFHLTSGLENEYYCAVGWEEEISSFPNIKGAVAAWFRTDDNLVSLADRGPLWPLVPQEDIVSSVGSILYPVSGGGWIKASYQGNELVTQWTRDEWTALEPWLGQRADARNSGAFPLADDPPTGLGDPTLQIGRGLELWPNPTSGVCDVQWRGLPAGPARLGIFDVRGRRVRNLYVGDLAASGRLDWDGRDESGQQVAAGTYLFILEHRRGRTSGRVVLAR